MPSIDDLEEMIATFRRLENFPEEAAKRAAPLVDAAVKRTASAGQDPDGKAWAQKKDGSQALKNVADHITTKAFGPVIRQTLPAPDAYHHFGTKRTPRRQVLPDAGAGTIPDSVFQALLKGATEAFDDAIK
jgi:hypothetical protein